MARKLSRKLSKEQRAVIREIKRLDRGGEALNISAVKRNQPELIAAAFAVKPFWGWKRAIEDAGLDYWRIRKQLEPYVYCEICGEPYRFLVSHIARFHGTVSSDYLMDYPNSALMSEEHLAERTARARKRGKKPFIAHWEPFWTGEYVLDRMWGFHEKQVPMNWAATSSLESGLPAFVARHLGDWDSVLKRLGLDPVKIRASYKPMAYSKKKVIETIRRMHEQDVSLAHVDMYHDNRPFLCCAERRFGNWRTAVNAAGVDYESVCLRNPRIKYHEAEDVIREIRRRKRRKQVLSFSGVRGIGHYEDEEADRALFNKATRLFGGWREAVEAAGFRYDRVCEPARGKPRKYSAAQDVVSEIKRRKRRGLPLNVAAVYWKHETSDSTLYRSAVREFGNWTKAIEKAGLDIRVIQQAERSPYHTREHVVREIRKRKRAGMSLALVGMIKGQQRDGTLVYLATSLFGSWRSAIEAAGLDYDKIVRTPERKYSTPESAVQAIQVRKRKGFPLKADAVCHGPHPDRPLYDWAIKYFGSWRDALSTAGIDPDRVKKIWRKYATPAEVLKGIRRRKRSREPLNSDALCRGPHADRPLVYAACIEYGSWPAAVEKAGLVCPVCRRKYPDRRAVVTEIRRRRRLNKPLNAQAIREGMHRDAGLFDNARREFGSWRAALEAAGIDPEISKKIRRRYATSAQVLKEIRRRKRSGRPLTAVALQAPGADCALLYAGRIEYGSWQAAVEAAGFVYPDSHQRKYPDRGAVIRGIKRRERAGMPLNAHALDKGSHRDKALRTSAVREFGSWRTAVEAAGIRYEDVIGRRPPSTRKIRSWNRQRNRLS